MHQIYSCSDENIEVFTTVIPSKGTNPLSVATAAASASGNESRSVVSDSLRPHGLYSPWNSPGQPRDKTQVSLIGVTSPARRRVKSSQHLLTKNVVIESDLYAPRPLELLPHRPDRRDGEGRRSGRFQNPRLQGPHPAKTPARPVGTSEPKSANLCGNRTYGKALMPPVARISVKAPTVLEAAAPGSENVAVLTRGSRHLKKMTEEFPTLPQGAEASLPLTGSAPCGMPSILRKMWTRHKKKSEYVGATNSAFEAD